MSSPGKPRNGQSWLSSGWRSGWNSQEYSGYKRQVKYNTKLDKNDVDFNKLNGTWYNSFWKLFKVAKSELNNIFDNTSFIVFNYERCVEQFLLNGICKYYDFKEIEAVKLIEKAKIYHPYGTVGRLPWQSSGTQVVEFGEEINNADRSLEVTQQIKTFSERKEESVELNAIRKLAQEANAIVFLGFRFHRQNMELLKPINPSKARRIFATTKGVSKSDCIQIRQSIIDKFGIGAGVREDFIQLRDMKCAELFNEFWISMTSV